MYPFYLEPTIAKQKHEPQRAGKQMPCLLGSLGHHTAIVRGHVSRLSQDNRDVFLLWHRVNTSAASHRKLIQQFGSARQALAATPQAWRELGIHNNHVARHQKASVDTDHLLVATLNDDLAMGKYQLVFASDLSYPNQLHQLYDPPPLLFYRGNLSRLNEPQIAVVGSRKPTEHAKKVAFDMAQYLADHGFIITSGLAQGIDGNAHLGALAQMQTKTGRTVGVMGTGIDVLYPKQHGHLIDRIVAEGGCVVTELLPGTQASKHTFPRRNRLVAGLSLGAIVVEATIKSGSLITARLTNEQGKQVFAVPSRIDNLNANGCHHLIREGATLVYHPDQVIEDIVVQLPTTPTDDQSTFAQTSAHKPKQTKTAAQLKATSTPHNISEKRHDFDIPKHLNLIWTYLDMNGQDLDTLIDKTNMATPAILADLMELELLGAAEQVNGRYKRVSKI